MSTVYSEVMKELFENVNFSLAKDILRIDTREKKAVKTILTGLCETQLTGKEQKPIRITITPDQPFRLAHFTNFIDDLGIDSFASSVKTDKETGNMTIIFQPRPRENNNFLKELLSSKEATGHFIKNFLDYEPYQVKSKPQK